MVDICKQMWASTEMVKMNCKGLALQSSSQHTKFYKDTETIMCWSTEKERNKQTKKEKKKQTW